MKEYTDMLNDVRRFLKQSSLCPYDLVRIARDLCRCQNCKYFIQHYDQQGHKLQFGHCTRLKNKVIKPDKVSCHSWYQKECIRDGGVP